MGCSYFLHVEAVPWRELKRSESTESQRSPKAPHARLKARKVAVERRLWGTCCKLGLELQGCSCHELLRAIMILRKQVHLPHQNMAQTREGITCGVPSRHGRVCWVSVRQRYRVVGGLHGCDKINKISNLNKEGLIRDHGFRSLCPHSLVPALTLW